MKEMHRAKICGRGGELPCPLQDRRSAQIFTCSPTQKLLEPCPLRVLRRTHYKGMLDEIIGHWCPNSASNPSRGQVSGTEGSNPLVTWLALMANSPHPQVGPKVTSFTQETSLSVSSWKIPRAIGALCQKQDRSKHMFITNHILTSTGFHLEINLTYLKVNHIISYKNISMYILKR